MKISSFEDVETLAYKSFLEKHKSGKILKGSDEFSRQPKFTRELLDGLGSPDKGRFNILITGSKGKGSLSIMISKILESYGYKVGLFTSPHLKDFRERIRINQNMISKDDLLIEGKKIESVYRDIYRKLGENEYIGPVGFTAAIAMSYFKRMDTDFNVIECGRGARYDDVNQIEGKLCGINKIFMEHLGNLGYSLDEVAHHKSGVIKEGMIGVFSAEQELDVSRVIHFEKAKKGVPLYEYGSSFKAEKIHFNENGSTYEVKTSRGNYKGVKSKLLGRHQCENGALSIAICEEVLRKKLELEKINIAFESINWPGRLEIICNKPLIILDGCISRNIISSIWEVLEKIKRGKIITVIGIPEDKDYLGVIEEVKCFSSKIIMTHAQNDYLKFSKEQVVKGSKIADIEFSSNVFETFEKLIGEGEDNNTILALGTQSFIKDVKIFFNQNTGDL